MSIDITSFTEFSQQNGLSAPRTMETETAQRDNHPAATETPLLAALRRGLDATSHPSVNGNWNDDHLAQEFIRQNEANLKFIAESSQWLIFTDELGWQRVSEAVVIDKVATMSRDIIGLSSRRSVLSVDTGTGAQARARHVATIGNKARICAAVALASADPRVRISALDIDRDPNLLGALNGVVNLADGTFHRFNREEMVTRRIACCYDPEAECPSFMQFIEEVQPDPEVRAYLQRLWGYSLSGHCGDHVVAFNFGGGANGKSTALDQMLLEIGGNYGAKISQALIYKRAVGPNPEIELARLDGVRFALGEENSENGSLNEDILKNLTGGDTIPARHPYGRHFEYRSQLKVHLHGNHQPRIQGTDDGIWRRFNLIEWGVQIPRERQDSTLPARLKQEFSGILNWLVQGSVEQISRGLRAPESVRMATTQFRSDSDTFGDFLSTMTVVDDSTVHPPSRILKSDLFESYNKYCEQQRILPIYRMSLRTLNRKVASRGFRTHRGTGGIEYWLGLRPIPSQAQTLGFN